MIQRDEHTVLRVGDIVRILHVKKKYNKGYSPGWTHQVYTVSRVIRTPKIEDQFSGPVQYIIRDYNGEDIKVLFMGMNCKK